MPTSALLILLGWGLVWVVAEGDSPPAAQCSSLLYNHSAWTTAFTAAQREIDPAVVSSVSFDKHRSALKNFFEPSWGSELFLIDNTTVAYMVIYKSYSEGISMNMMNHDSHHAHHRTEGSAYRTRRCTSKGCQQRMTRKKLGHDKVERTFTFVRHPLSHFISGVVEAQFRKLGLGSHPKEGPSLEAQFKKHTMSVSDAQTILEAILKLDGKAVSRYLSATEHYSIQSHSLHYWNPEFVGTLENIDTEWGNLNRYLGSNITLHNYETHDTSHDPMNMKASLLALLRSEKKYLRAICRILLVDFVCLSSVYDLPPECADMLPAKTGPESAR